MNTNDDILRALAELAQLAMLPPPADHARHQKAAVLHLEILRLLGPQENMRLWMQRQIGEALDLDPMLGNASPINFTTAAATAIDRLKGTKPPAAVESPEAA